MFGLLKIIKKHLYTFTHNVGFQINLHDTTDTNDSLVILQHNSMNKHVLKSSKLYTTRFFWQIEFKTITMNFIIWTCQIANNHSYKMQLVNYQSNQLVSCPGFGTHGATPNHIGVRPRKVTKLGTPTFEAVWNVGH